MDNATHPALAHAPKSTREALQRIVDYGKANKFANSQYEDSRGNCCAIGLFFTQEQRNDIKKRSAMNCKAIGAMVEKIGVQNIEAMTGMSIAQARVIQYLNDERRTMLLPKIRAVLNGKTAKIFDITFKV